MSLAFRLPFVNYTLRVLRGPRVTCPIFRLVVGFQDGGSIDLSMQIHDVMHFFFNEF